MPESTACDCPLCGSAVPPAVLTVPSGRYRHCRVCDLVFQEPGQRPDADAEHAHYLTHENRVDDPRYRTFLSQLAEPMMRRLAAGAEGLDVGAGPGPALAAMFTERGFPTAIYDPFFAPDLAVLARPYDFIVCTEVAEHMYHPGREFALFDRLLESGSWLGLMTELRPALEHFSDWYYHRDPTHVCFYSADTIQWIVRHFCWQIDRLDTRVILLRKE